MTLDPSGKVKGFAINGIAKYIKKRWGNDGLQACSKAIDLDLVKVQNERWYLHAYPDDIADWIAETHGEDHLRKAGFSVSSEVGIISYAARIIGIERVINRAVREYTDSVDFGHLESEVRKGSATIRLWDHVPNTRGCEIWHGLLLGIQKLTNVTGTVEHSTCQFRGDQVCTYELTWS